jgi:hypothetical protein
MTSPAHYHVAILTNIEVFCADFGCLAVGEKSTSLAALTWGIPLLEEELGSSRI